MNFYFCKGCSIWMDGTWVEHLNSEETLSKAKEEKLRVRQEDVICPICLKRSLIKQNRLYSDIEEFLESEDIDEIAWFSEEDAEQLKNS